jgi:hypothetical protein
MITITESKTKKEQVQVRKLDLIFKFSENFDFNVENCKERLVDFKKRVLNRLEDTKISSNEEEKVLVFHFRYLSNEKFQKERIKNFSEKYSYLREIILSEPDDYSIDLIIEQRRNEENISEHDITKIPCFFIDNISSSNLEILLINTILNKGDEILTKENIERLGFIDEYSLFVELISQNPIISGADIQRIFLMIDPNLNTILKEFLIYFMLKATGKQNIKDIQFYYSQVHPFKKILPYELKSDLFDDDLILSKAYFRREYLRDKLNDLREIYESEGRVRLQIPLDYNKYNLKFLSRKVAERFIIICTEKPYILLDGLSAVLKADFKHVCQKEIEPIISFEIEQEKKELIKDLEEKNLYFKNIKRFYHWIGDLIESLQYTGEKKIDIEKFVILHGFYSENENNVKITWSRDFKLIDFAHESLTCSVEKHKDYFKEKPVSKDAEILVQGKFLLRLEYDTVKEQFNKKEKVFSVRDLDVIDDFKAISVYLGEIFQGKQILENTRRGVAIKTYPRNKEKHFITKILAVPIILEEIYQRKDEDQLYYKVRLENNIVIATKEELCEYIEKETDLAFKFGTKLKEAITQILRKYRQSGEYKVLPMIDTVGAFLDEDDEIFLSNPFNEDLVIVGKNSLQNDVIERTERIGLDDGSLTRDYFEIWKTNEQRLNVRIAEWGYSAIQPFFHALGKEIKVKPYLMLLGKGGTGKTTMLKLLLCKTFGLIEKSAENFDSLPRTTVYGTTSTYTPYIDDIDNLDEKQVSWFKAIATGNIARERLQTDSRTMKSDIVYSAFAGSGNKKEFIMGSKHEALRMRCILMNLYKVIELTEENKEDIKRFERHYEKIMQDGKLYGYYLMEKALEYVDKKIKSKGLLKREKFGKVIKETKGKINKLKLSGKIQLSDPRRAEIYALVHVGLQIWNYIFQEQGLFDEELIELVEFRDDKYISFINELESNEKDFEVNVFDNILSFYISKREAKSYDKWICKKEDNAVILQLNFVNDYDAWGIRRHYEALGNLTVLAEKQSKLLGRKIKAKTYYMKHRDTGKKKSDYGVPFFFNEIYRMRVNKKEEELTDQEIDQDFREKSKNNPEKLDKYHLDKMFSKDRKYQKFQERVSEIFETSENIEKKSLIQILELEDLLSRNDVKKYLNLYLDKKILTNRNGNYLEFDPK